MREAARRSCQAFLPGGGIAVEYRIAIEGVSMATVSGERRWIVAAAVLAAGVPLIAGVGLALTMVATALLGRFLPGWGFWLLWLGGCGATAVAVWFLVRRCVRIGGWRTLGLGVGTGMIIPIASYTLGAVTQAVRPGANGMAGIAWEFLAYPFGVSLLLALVMGAIAIRFGSAGDGLQEEPL